MSDDDIKEALIPHDDPRYVVIDLIARQILHLIPDQMDGDLAIAAIMSAARVGFKMAPADIRLKVWDMYYQNIRADLEKSLRPPGTGQ